jgi:NitT/TauT family transport system substrate-binding protein
MHGKRVAVPFFALAILAGSWATAAAQDLLKIAVPQRGVWDAGVPELGMRGGIFQKHGLNLEILYTQAGPESIQALIAGSVDLATAAGVSAAFFNDKTVAYSLTGSSSHAGLLALIAQYNLRVKPTSTGNIPSTLTQTLSGQVEVGFGAVPFALDLAEEGRIRIIITGNDVASLKTRTGRVNLTNLATLQNRRDALVRFHQAYKETVDWMYSDPAALKQYSDFSKVPEKVVLKVRELMPKAALAPERVVGIDQIMTEAIQNKFLQTALTKEQLAELIRTSDVMK